MGRQQYLTRLALGRSPFQALDQDESISPASPASGSELQHSPDRAPSTSTTPHTAYTQLYDSRGRPMNPSSEARRTAQLKAQNNILALVGVVEREDHADTRAAETKQLAQRKQRYKTLRAENDCGEVLETLSMALRFLSHLWLDAITQRVQIGLYDVHTPIAEIVSWEWQRVRRAGSWQRGLATLFPGLGSSLVYGLVKIPTLLGIHQLAGRLQYRVGRQRWRTKTLVRLYSAITLFCQMTVLGIDLLLLPIDFHSSAQRLGLAEDPLPLFPPLTSLLPWRAESFHHFGWTSFFPWSEHGLIIPHLLASTAGLMLLSKVLHSEGGDEGPIHSNLTEFTLPNVTDAAPDTTPSPFSDPIGNIMHKVYLLRTGMLRWCGWAMTKRPTTEPRLSRNYLRFEENTQTIQPSHSTTRRPHLALDTSHPASQTRRIPRSHATATTTHRSTALAELPAQHLGYMIDDFLLRLLTLPLDSFVVRSLASTFLKHTTHSANPPTLHRPFPWSSTPFGRVWAAAVQPLAPAPSTRAEALLTAVRDAEAYMNQLGLTLALHCAVDCALFSAFYLIARAWGRGRYHWHYHTTSLTEQPKPPPPPSAAEAALPNSLQPVLPHDTTSHLPTSPLLTIPAPPTTTNRRDSEPYFPPAPPDAQSPA